MEQVYMKGVYDLIDLGTSDESEAEDAEVNTFCDLQIVKKFRFGDIQMVPKQLTWLSEVLPEYDECRFREVTRVSFAGFDKIYNLIKDNKVFQTSKQQIEVSVQLALTMLRLGINGNTISNIARLFGVGDGSTIIRTKRRVFCAILGFENNFIYWPSNEERAELIIPAINEDLPKCVGFIDGTKIELDEAPGLDPEAYFDKDSYPGSVHDSRVWNESYMNHHRDIFFSRNNSNEISDKDRNWFNKYFVNGILKENFQSLEKLKLKLNSVEDHSHAVNWIKVCLILYNILNETENGNRWYIPKYTENRQELSSEMDNQDTVDDFSASDKRMTVFYFIKAKLGK